MEDKECPDFRLGTVDKKLLALRWKLPKKQRFVMEFLEFKIW
jgi:hypothetical protein